LGYSICNFKMTIFLQILNKGFIHSPAKKEAKTFDLVLASLTNQNLILRCGSDKTTMYEAEFWHGICRMGKVSTSYLQCYNHAKYCTISTKIKQKIKTAAKRFPT